MFVIPNCAICGMAYIVLLLWEKLRYSWNSYNAQP